MRGWPMGLLCLALLPGAALGDTFERSTSHKVSNHRACRGPDYTVEACSAIIEGGRLTPLILPGAYSDRGLAWLHHDDFDRAIADFDQAITRDPTDADFFNNRGYAYAEKHMYERAIADYDAALRLRADFPAAFDNRGRAQAAQRHSDQAIADFDQAIALREDFARAFFDRGGAWRDKGEYDRAIADFDQAILIDPRYAAAFNYRGLTYQDKAEPDRAIKDFNQALLIAPKFAGPLNNRGYAWVTKQQYDRAIADFDAAIATSPDWAAPYNGRGLAYAGKGQFDRAIADYDAAIRRFAGYAWAFSARGYAYAAKGETAQAIASYDEAIRLSPGYKSAMSGRAAALARDHAPPVWLAFMPLAVAVSAAVARRYQTLFERRCAQIAVQAHRDAQRIIDELTQWRDQLQGRTACEAPAPGEIAAVDIVPVRERALSRRLRALPLPGWLTADVSARTGARIIGAGMAVVILIGMGFAARHLIERVEAARRDPLQAFVQYFDADVGATAPALMKIAQQDPLFHRAFLEHSKQAYAKGGWVAVNAALYPFLDRELAVYADDARLRSLASAHYFLLTELRLWKSFNQCKLLGLAPRTDPALPFDASYMRDLVGQLEAVVQQGGRARQEGVSWTPRTDDEAQAAWRAMRDGKQTLSEAEIRALMSKASAGPALYCQAAIKVIDNILSLPDAEGMRVYRVFLAHAEQDDWIGEIQMAPSR